MATSIYDLPPMERLAIEQALYSRIGEDVSTKNMDSLRRECDRQVLVNYQTTGAKSYDTFVNGHKVGTYAVRVGKGKEGRTERRVVVRDPYEFDQYIKGEAMDEALDYLHLMSQNLAEYLLETYGIVGEGCEVVEEEVPAEPPKVLGTTLRIDADKVAEAIAGYLPTTVAGFIGGDDE